MKKILAFTFVLVLAIGASAQSATTVGPVAHGSKVGPVANPGPVAVPKSTKK